MANAEPWVVWSFEHDAWWAPNEHGYVQQLAAAGRYTEAQAVEIERMANKHGPENEKAMSLASATALIDGVDEETLMRRVRAIAGDPTRHSPGAVYTSMAREIIRLRAAMEPPTSGLRDFFVLDPSVPRDELHVRVNGRLAAKVVGLSIDDDISLAVPATTNSATSVRNDFNDGAEREG